MFCFLIILTIILILKVLIKNTNTKSVLSALVALSVGQVLVNLSISVDIYSAKNLLNLIELLKQQYKQCILNEIKRKDRAFYDQWCHNENTCR